MRYFIFNYKRDLNLINSFVLSASKAHGHSISFTKEWFLWKFRDNPFGESILACAEENDEIIGCVGYGIQPFLLNGNLLKGVLSFETFVHPDYQGKGIFSKLIQLAELELKVQNVDFILNFPNDNSINGFLKNGWKMLTPPEYRIRIVDLFSSVIYLHHLKNEFKSKKQDQFVQKPFSSFEQHNFNRFFAQLSLDYINWRFFTNPIHDYVKIEKNEYQAVMMVGKRGKIKEGHILFLNVTDSQSFSLTALIDQCKSLRKIDVLSMAVTKSNSIRKNLSRHGFILVPSKVRMCYKILSEKAVHDNDFLSLSFEGINHHTN